MTRAGPPSSGLPEAELDTPALVVDLDALERNLDRMAAAARTAGSPGAGLPIVQGGGELYKRFADEHGVLAPSDGPLPELGNHVRLIPVSCDPTVNLYDHLVGVRNGLVEQVWAVYARGY